MDEASRDWVTELGSSGPEREEAIARLHLILLKVATKEAFRRGPAARITGPELEDLAQQAADDALVLILRKLDTFRGESRFTTWAYRFAVLEVANKIGRHYWRRPSVSLDAEDWDRFPERIGLGPESQAQHQELITAVRRVVEEALTPRQRTVFIAQTVNDVPADALAAKLGVSRGAIHKTLFDARRKIRAFLVTNGYIESGPTAGRTVTQTTEVE